MRCRGCSWLPKEAQCPVCWSSKIPSPTSHGVPWQSGCTTGTTNNGHVRKVSTRFLGVRHAAKNTPQKGHAYGNLRQSSRSMDVSQYNNSYKLHSNYIITTSTSTMSFCLKSKSISCALVSATNLFRWASLVPIPSQKITTQAHETFAPIQSHFLSTS